MPMRNIGSRWKFQDLADVPGNFQSAIGGYSIVSQSLFRRGLSNLDDALGFLNPDQYHPAPASELPGLLKAADRIQEGISSGGSILVWGDFDVDGQTSTTLLTSGLRELGADTSYYIPNRATESHGVSVAALTLLIDQLDPQIIITCDTGIDAIEPVNYANSKGVDFIITDHHQLPPRLPEAYAIINPAMLNPAHPLGTLPGVGVSYKLIEELFSRYDLDPLPFLDLVALGIVADVADLSRDTRYLLQLGLPVLRRTSRLGLGLLYKNANLNAEDISEDQIGFVIGPRLNALGRLSDASSCVDFFTSDDPTLVNELASRLESLNTERQELTEKIFIEALEMINAFPDLSEEYPVLVIQGPSDWNPGVIGIVASRLVERFNKPAIVLTQDGAEARGSARSVPGIGISDLISEASSLLISHGGHPMAAGVSLPLENVTQFRRKLAENYHALYGETDYFPNIVIDAELPFHSITVDFIEDFNRMAPFGAGNPRLLFATRNVTLLADNLIGRKRNHRKLTLADSSGTKQDFLWWNSLDLELPESPFDISYSLNISTYRNVQQVQATIQHYQQSNFSPVYISKKHKIELIDLRESPNPLAELYSISEKEKDFLIWSEFSHPDGFLTHPRLSLSAAKTLIIWSTPPSFAVLKHLIELVGPEKIIFFSQGRGITSQVEFLENLLGLLKHLSASNKIYDPDLFAQRLALTSSLIEAGLDWLHYHGDFDLSNFRHDFQLEPGPKIPLPEFEKYNRKLNLMYHEVSAFQDYIQNANINSVL